MLTITQRQIRNSPIIVGEQYELVETVAAAYGDNHSGGLLAKPDYTTAILSMSGYEKAQNSGLNGKFDSIYGLPRYYIILPAPSPSRNIRHVRRDIVSGIKADMSLTQIMIQKDLYKIILV